MSSQRTSKVAEPPHDAPPHREDELVLALDLGSSRVAAALATLERGRTVVLAAECATSYGLRDGEVVDLQRAAESIGIVTQAVQEHVRTRVRRVVVAFSGPAKLSVSRGTLAFSGGKRPSNTADVERLRRTIYPDGNPQRETVHRSDGPYSVGDLHGIERPHGLIGASLGMSSTFLTAPALALEHLRKAVRMASLKVEQIVLAPHAASLGVLSPDERALGAAVLDFGAGAFRGILWEGGRLRQMHVSNQDRSNGAAAVTPAPGGMDGVLLALARHFRISVATAARLVREQGHVCTLSSASVRAVEVTAVDGLSNLWLDLGEFSHTLESILTPHLRALRDGLPLFSESHAAGVVLTGAGARLPGLEELVSRHFGDAPVRIGTPHWDIRGRLSPELDGPGGSTLCGLIHSGFEQRGAKQLANASQFRGLLRSALHRMVASW
jgi:cell division protein FtsA